MSREYSFFNSKSFSIKALLFVFTFLGVAGLLVPTTVNAIDGAKKQGCVGFYTTTHTSPFSKTSKQCLGTVDSSGAMAYFQIAIELKVPISSAEITAKNGNGDSIRFIKQSDKLFVSEPDSRDSTVGYMGVMGSNGAACNRKDGVNIIKVTAKANGNTQPIDINLCDYKTNYVVGKVADDFETGDGGTKAPELTTGCIAGNLGLVRDDPTPNWSVQERNAKLQKGSVTAIKVSGPTNHNLTNSPDINSAKWFTLSDGAFEISGLNPGSYSIELKYNDKLQAVEEIGPNADTWTTGEAVYKFSLIRVAAGKDCATINNGDPYLLSATTGKVTEPVGEGEDEADKSSCRVEGVGWIVCPVITFIAKISDGAFEVIEQMLELNVKLLDTNSGTFSAWSAFRNVANIAFAIVFLIIIYSQLTGVGVSNYGIKKTLPRLVVTVILVNVSFYMCQLAVDITQIIGASLRNFLSSIPVSGASTVPISFGQVANDILTGTGIAVLAVGTVAVAATAIALGVATPVLLAILVAVLMTVIILMARQAAIVILIALAPLAFVAYLLPNTESWFKKWYKMFFALLLLYPIIALLFGGGELAAKILANVATEAPAAEKFTLSIMSIGVSAIPLIFVPTLLKGALNSMGSIGGKLSGFAAKANSRVGSTAASQTRLGEARQGLKNRFALRRATRRATSERQKAIDQSRLGRALGLDKGTARALKAVDQEQDSEVEAKIAQIQHQTTSTNRVGESARMLKEAIKAGDITTARAAQKILLNSGATGIHELQKVYSDKFVAKDMVDNKDISGYLRSELNSAGLKGKNNALARFGYEGPANALAEGYDKPVTDDNGKVVRKADGTIQTQKITAYAQDAETYSKLNPVELAGQNYKNLEAIKDSITVGEAAAVLDNSAAFGILDGQKRKLLAEIAGRDPNDPSKPAPVTTPQQAANTQPNNTGGSTPTQNPGLSNSGDQVYWKVRDDNDLNRPT